MKKAIMILGYGLYLAAIACFAHNFKKSVEKACESYGVETPEEAIAKMGKNLNGNISKEKES